MIFNVSSSSGWIEVVCGSMFSGKTQELIRRLKLASIAKQKVQVFTQVVGIDEAHFFGDEIVEVAQKLADSGRRVIVAGLDQDYRGEAFANMAKLMAVSEFVTKNLAICMVCGNPAHYSQRLTDSGRRIEVGAGDKYEARCRKCFQPEK